MVYACVTRAKSEFSIAAIGPHPLEEVFDMAAAQGGAAGSIADAAYLAPGERLVTKAEERRVIVASSVGTVFEWYDFYLYAILAPFFAGLFFPPGNQTAALLGAFGAYATGFLVRPF